MRLGAPRAQASQPHAPPPPPPGAPARLPCSTVTDVTVNTVGLIIAGVSVVSSGMQQIMCGVVQRKHKISSHQLLANTAPVQVGAGRGGQGGEGGCKGREAGERASGLGVRAGGSRHGQLVAEVLPVCAAPIRCGRRQGGRASAPQQRNHRVPRPLSAQPPGHSAAAHAPLPRPIAQCGTRQRGVCRW
jgi:hypothetical protein